MSKELRDSVVSRLEDKGWSRAQAYGIAANLSAESTFNHKAVGDGGKAYGLAQWHPDRQAEFAKTFGKDIRESTWEEQVDFVDHELRRGKEQAAGKKLLSAGSAQEAARIVMNDYERPAAVEREKGEKTRVGLAATWANEAVAPRAGKAPSSPERGLGGTTPAAAAFSASTAAKEAAFLGESAARADRLTDTSVTGPESEAQEAAQARSAQARNDTGFWESLQTGRMDPRVQAGFTVADAITNWGEAKEVAPAGWDYWLDRDKNEAGLTVEEVNFQRENGQDGPQALARAKAQLALRRSDDQTYANAGLFDSFAGQMVAGAMDPAGWIAGFGVSKLASLAKVGAGAYALAGRPGMAAVSFAAENVVGNVALEGVQDALGEVKGTSDYVAAAGMGVVFSAPFLKSTYRGAVNDYALAQANELLSGAADHQAGSILSQAAQGRSGGEAAKAAQTAEVEAINRNTSELAGNPGTRDVNLVPPDVEADIRRGLDPAPERTQPTAIENPETGARVDPIEPEVQTPAQVIEGVNKAVTGTEATGRDIVTAEGDTVRVDWIIREKTAKDHGNVGEVLTLLKANKNADNYLSKLIDYIGGSVSDDIKAVGVNFKYKRRGEFDPNINQIKGRTTEPTKGKTVEQIVAGLDTGAIRTVVHEVAHAVTHAKIESFLTKGGAKQSPSVRAAMKELNDVYTRFAQYVKADPARFPNANQGAAYAHKNLHEFVAQTWSDPETQAILREMPGTAGASSTSSSAWKSFVRVIQKLLGADKGNALQEAFTAIDNLMTADGSNIKYGMGSAPVLQAPAGPALPPQVASMLERQRLERLHQHHSQIMSGLRINPHALETFTKYFKKYGGMSDGLVLLTSNNPTVKVMGAFLTEATTGAAGRNRSVALRSHLWDQMLMGQSIPQYNGAFHLWAKESGYGYSARAKSVISGELEQKFNREVTLEIWRRRDPGYQSTEAVPKGVAEAADAIEGVMQRGADLQRRTGTLGADALPESSRGYLPQELIGAKLAALDSTTYAAARTAFARQAGERFGWDRKFAQSFADHYMERARFRALETQIDDVVHNGQGDSVIAETLMRMGLDGEAAARDLGRASASAAGPKHTRKRLDWDLLEDLGDGTLLGDLFRQDPATLARQYSRRNAGFSALAEKGVLGWQGMRDIINAAGGKFTPGTEATLPELEALRRSFAEVLGLSHNRTTSRGLSNIGLLTNWLRLGALPFTQAAESLNVATTLGVRYGLAHIPAVMRSIKDVGRVKRGEPVANVLLRPLETLYGVDFGAENYRMVMSMDPPDATLAEYARQPGTASRILRAGSHSQSVASGFRALMAAQHRAAAEQITLKALRYIDEVAGKGGKVTEANRALRDMGFSDELIEKFAAESGQLVAWEGNQVKAFNLDQISDPALGEQFAEAVHRGTSQIIQGTFVGEKSAWMHNDIIGFFAKFRTFGLIAMEKQWSRQAALHSDGPWGRAGGIAWASMALGAQAAMSMPLYIARVHLASSLREDREKYLEENLSATALVRGAMNSVSLSGIMGDVIDISTTAIAGFGGDAGRELVGGRAGNVGGVGRILPNVGTLDSLYRVATGQTTAYGAAKTLPYSSIWYLAPPLGLLKDDN